MRRRPWTWARVSSFRRTRAAPSLRRRPRRPSRSTNAESAMALNGMHGADLVHAMRREELRPPAGGGHVEYEFDGPPMRAEAQHGARGDAAGEQIASILHFIELIDVEHGVEVGVFVMNLLLTEGQSDGDVIASVDQFRARA